MSARRAAVAALALALSAAATAQALPRSWAVAARPVGMSFADVTTVAGIQWTQLDPGNKTGAGGAWLDYDQDGWPDLLLVGGLSVPGLYHNLGNGAFADVSATAALARGSVGGHMGVAVADYDNDGDPDIYIVADGRNALYRNDGAGAFTDMTAAAGVASAEWSTAAAFGDYDGDGWVDLYVGNYIAALRFPNHIPHPNTLYHNNGDGTFTDVTALCGVAGAGTTLAVCWSDYDGDGDLDLWVGNDFGRWVEPNRLYRNDGPGFGLPGAWSFAEVSAQLGADAAIYCMGIAGGDIDRDLDLDYYFSNLGRNVMLRNDGAVGFADVTTETGTENTLDPSEDALRFATSWGVGFHDFDLDGWVDLYVSNGHIPAAAFLFNGTRTPSALFRNNGFAGTFTDVALPAGVAHRGLGRGVCFADYDRDGDVDILQCNIDAPPALLRNDSPRQGHWLSLRPRGRLSSADACGARIVVDVGGDALLREVRRNDSFESSSELTVHVGVGDHKVVDRVHVRWPSGVDQQLHHLASDTHYQLVEPWVGVGSGSTGPAAAGGGTSATFTLEIENHTAVAQTVTHRRVLAFGDTRQLPTAAETVTVPAGGVVLLSRAIALPSPATNVSAALYWEVSDAGGGRDEWRRGFVVMRSR